jgi:uncharacterized protein YxeA
MKEIITSIILSVITLVSAYFIYRAVEPTVGYQVGFCKTLYKGNNDKINQCLDNYDEMHNRTGIYDENGKPVQ